MERAASVCCGEGGPQLTLPTCDEKAPLDQTQAGLLEMWWNLVQDQVGSLKHEIESLRLVSSQTQARLAEVLTHRLEPAPERTMSILGVEVQRLGADLQVEREERAAVFSKILERVQSELQRHAGAIETKLSSDRVELREALGKELRADLQQLEPVSEVAQDVTSLRKVLEQEVACRIDAEQRSMKLVEASQRLASDLDQERLSQSSNFSMLQSQMQALTREIEVEREEWTQRRGDLLENVLQKIGDQDQHLTQEREQTRALLGRARQILDSDDALRVQLQKLLHTEMVSKGEFLAETQHLWQAVKLEVVAAGSRGPSRHGSPARQLPRTPRVPQQFTETVFQSDATGAGTMSCGPSRTHSITTPAQPVQLAARRALSAGVYAAPVPFKVLDIHRTVDLHWDVHRDLHRSFVSSVATLPPCEDASETAETVPDLRSILHNCRQQQGYMY